MSTVLLGTEKGEGRQRKANDSKNSTKYLVGPNFTFYRKGITHALNVVAIGVNVLNNNTVLPWVY